MITNLGRYTIEEELGRGGMGVVYRARDTKLGKIVAVKVLAEGRGVGADSRSRFRHEARAAAVLNHPSIVAVFDYDEQDGVPFIVSEYVEGKSLDKLIAEDSLTEDEIVDIGVQIARALAYAHERGILHRDIKPQNIIVRKDGVAKILDFGLAKKAHLDFAASDGTTLESPSFATAVGTLVGTPQYMSPEQIGGEILDGRTDIFSFGIVLYEMASGKNPFQGTSFASTVGRIMSANAPNLPDESCQYSEGLCNVVIRCLQKKREDRYPNAEALLEDLERLGRASSQRRRARGGQISRERSVSVIPRQIARVLLILMQIAYLATYGVMLFYYFDVFRVIYRHLGSHYVQLWTTLLLTLACCGIPMRLFLMVSVGFDDPETGIQFRRIFPFLFVIDEIWALSPLLLVDKWRAGITIVFVALLAYLPMSQRTLIKSAYSTERPSRTES